MAEFEPSDVRAQAMLAPSSPESPLSPRQRARPGRLESPADDRFYKGRVARVGKPESDSEIQLQLVEDVEVERRHDELLLMLDAG